MEHFLVEQILIAVIKQACLIKQQQESGIKLEIPD
jgi:hypothetical protein